MSKPTAEQPRRLRCAIYTRKSSEEGLDQEYNSLDAQRDAGEAYIASQKHEGWVMVPEFYDDGGFSGGNLERPALKRLLDDKGHVKFFKNADAYGLPLLPRSRQGYVCVDGMTLKSGALVMATHMKHPDTGEIFPIADLFNGGVL